MLYRFASVFLAGDGFQYLQSSGFLRYQSKGDDAHFFAAHARPPPSDVFLPSVTPLDVPLVTAGCCCFHWFTAFLMGDSSVVVENIFLSEAMSSITLLSTTLAYIWVVDMAACPSILDTVSMGIPFCRVMVVAKVWRERWIINSKAGLGTMKLDNR